MKINDTVMAVYLEPNNTQGLVLWREYKVEQVNDTFIKVEGLSEHYKKERFVTMVPTITDSGNARFFHHLFSETAIGNNWDYEQSLPEFVTEIIKNKPAVMKAEAFVIASRHGEAKLTELDVYLASQNKVTESFANFYTIYYKGLTEKGLAENPVVQQSMHSGSSDYLFRKDIEAMVEKYKEYTGSGN